MKILVVNAGSSSLKYQLIDMEGEKVLAKGNCERIGGMGVFSYKTEGTSLKKEVEMADHKAAFDIVINEMMNGENKVIDSVSEIGAVGHRVVQGGSGYSQSTLIDEKVIADIEKYAELAPLHNRANITGIQACIDVLGKDVPQVAVFDTSFHQTMPAKAYMFAVPYEYYEKYNVRRYGYHGTSHRFVSAECAKVMGKDIKDLKIITCHLGNGCSIAAVDGGKSVDTSMGLTPVDGFMMGTRVGSIDPSVLTYIAEKEGMSLAEINDMCNKKSGLLGISGVSNDSRDVCEGAANGHERCQLAIDMQQYQIIKHIGAYAAAMNGVDAIVFTAGIGENNPDLRKNVMESITYLGVEADNEANAEPHVCENLKISTDSSKVACYVIPTNEELVIARDTLEIVTK